MPSSMRLLIVDDHIEMANMLADQLADEGYAVDVADSGTRALKLVERRLPDVVVTDLRMEGTDGLDVLDGVRDIDPLLPVIIMTAFGAVETAIEAIQRGAFHYITKPFDLKELQLLVERAFQARRLKEENRALNKIVTEGSDHRLLVGESAAMRELQRMIDRVAVSEAPVLVLGESGVGKELVARNIHAIGPRNARRLIAINCTTLPDALLESELFGHVKGAFTGATRSRRGLFQEADGGTLFLDEIGEMPTVLQAKLLRVLEDGEIRAVGADVTHHVDVRVIAATHCDLARRVAERRFREDLFFRLNVLPVHVPALRERGDDIRLLALFFLAKARAVTPGTFARHFTAEALSMLNAHSWPGNVRELDNVVRRLVLLSDAEEIGVHEVSACRLQVHGGKSPGAASIAVTENGIAPDPGTEEPPSTDRVLEVCEPAFSQLGSLPPPLSAMEDAYISWVIARCEGNKARAARHLGVDVSTLHRRERRQRRMPKKQGRDGH